MEPSDFFNFDKMLTPKIITLVYWLALAGWLVGGIMGMSAFGEITFKSMISSIFLTLCGMIGTRIGCELLILLFKMNETLHEIRNKP